MRGRILAVASSWSGSPASLISSMTTAASVPSSASTALTLPTSTPAIRTGEFGRGSSSRTRTRALTWKPLRERDVLREAEEHERRRSRRARSAPTATGCGRRGGGGGARPSAALPSVARLLRAGHVADHRAARRRYGSLPASHSRGWPGAAVFGYGLVCRWLSARRPVGGRRRRAALVVRALRRGDDDEPLPGAVAVALAEQRGDVAEPQRRRSCRRSGPARGSRSVGFERLDASRSVALMPRGTSGSSANVCSSLEQRREPAVERRRRAAARACRSRARRRASGAAVRSARDARLQLAEQALGVGAGTAAGAGTSRSPASSAGAPSVIESWMYGRATSRSARERGVEVARTAAACVSAAGATIAAASPSSSMKRREVRSRARRGSAPPGRCRAAAGGSAPIAVLIDSPRPANASPKPSRFACDAARVSSSNMFRNSSNSTGVGVALRERDRVAVLEALVRRARA